MRMKVRIKSYHHATFGEGAFENFVVLGFGHPNFTSVNRVEARLSKKNCRRARSSLIERQFHLTAIRSIILSSRLAAAKASAS